MDQSEMSAFLGGCQTWTLYSAMDASLWTLSCFCMISFTREDMKNESGLIKEPQRLLSTAIYSSSVRPCSLKYVNYVQTLTA